MFWKPVGFDISNRIRLEYRYYDYQSDACVFRNKLDIKFPWKFTRLAIRPMVADEIFYKFNGGELDENRLYAGFVFDVCRSLKGELCYMLRSNKDANISKWTSMNVLVAKLKLAF